ncbi:hypothetical protein A3K73_08610 [Candidatus Pacearchaeota archaeon RBG_13_36_9]|nr:MAG: hypothetical protein A3K73_08610 [Candidatus Pacearchaeota archaeon RBG_13_36_9]HJX50460.1 hypothetical protein [Candidatus Nanoarchaeia archaeon]
MGRYNGYTWVYSPKAVKVPEEIKKEIETEATKIIERLKKEYIMKMPKKLKYNHLVGIYGKWIQQRFYFCSKYICPKGYLAPWSENRFARLEYTGKEPEGRNKFQLFFMRHTGEWIKILEDKKLGQCLEEIETSPYFRP